MKKVKRNHIKICLDGTKQMLIPTEKGIVKIELKDDVMVISSQIPYLMKSARKAKLMSKVALWYENKKIVLKTSANGFLVHSRLFIEVDGKLFGVSTYKHKFELI